MNVIRIFYDKKNGKGEKETTILTVMEDYSVNQSFDWGQGD